MKATKPISAGEQIFNDYGPLPRSDLVRMYGYITDNYAQYDVVEFSHDTLLEVVGKKHNMSNKSWLKRQEQLDELGLLDDGYAIPRPEQNIKNFEDAIPGQLHMLLQALCTNGNYSEAIRKPKNAVTIEEAALLQAVLTKKLSEYGTSYGADEAIWKTLQSEPKSAPIPTGCNAHRYIMALQVRMGEKEILRQLIQLCQAHIQQKSDEMREGPLKRKNADGSDHHSKKIARKDKNQR